MLHFISPFYREEIYWFFKSNYSEFWHPIHLRENMLMQTYNKSCHLFHELDKTLKKNGKKKRK
jgi:hypothetical protein